MLTKDSFEKEIFEALKSKPKEWRDGQFIFNYVDKEFGGVAKVAQFKKGIDCFYDDTKIQNFLDCCYGIINNKK